MAKLSYSPGWAVGSIFLPVANLVIPLLVVQEIWKASDPQTPPDDPKAWRKNPLSFLAVFWWIVSVSALVVSLVYLYLLNTSQTAMRRQTLENLTTALTWNVIAQGLSILGGLLFMAVVIMLVIRQDRKLRNLRFEEQEPSE